MTSWTVQVDPLTSFTEALRTEESFLRKGTPAVHVAVLDGTVVSYGAGVPDSASYLAAARARGIPSVRRASGGTGVLHLQGDLVWSVVLPRADPRVGRDFVRAYARLGAGLVAALARHGVTSSWVSAPGLSDEYCPLGARGSVLAVGGQIVAAAAQHLTGTALLHQGTLSMRVDRGLVRDLFAFAEESTADRLTGLEELAVHTPPERLAEEAAECLVDALDRR